ncbi:Hypothetical protein PBC10988_37730 [Planctomycetales bacterium 10988]|nr:Hypothetical protein PBC10988_37730 [Planctomycetales bacterium 10988]
MSEQVSQKTPASLGPNAQMVLSFLIVMHLLGVLAAPMFMPPGSRLMSRLYTGSLFYTRTLSLDMTYRFFSPDPGPSKMMRYELTLADGETKTGYLAEANSQWPRCRYHRHFMLSEKMGGWHRDHTLYNAYLQDYANHLMKEHQAKHVKLYLIYHQQPNREAFVGGTALDDSTLYREEQVFPIPAEAEESA